jgi:FkbM family methyltransferase
MRSMSIRHLAKSLFRKMGYLVEPYNVYNDLRALRTSLLASNGINVVFDVGANEGQFARELRRDGYEGRIISFEPVAQVYEKLAINAKGDTKWETNFCALGSFVGKAEINVAINTVSSSLLNMLPRHLEGAPESRYVRREEISVKKVDSIIGRYLANGEKLYLKIDAQGYERHIIEGCENSMERICGIELEMSMAPLYEGETLIGDMINFLSKKNYALISIEPVYRDVGTHELLQVDGIFVRKG